MHCFLNVCTFCDKFGKNSRSKVIPVFHSTESRQSIGEKHLKGTVHTHVTVIATYICVVSEAERLFHY